MDVRNSSSSHLDGSILSRIGSPKDLHGLNDAQLEQLSQEMRDELVRVLRIRPAHFASNLGVVELCLALHMSYDFSKDRLIWNTGHQIYPHKLITGRQHNFDTIRTRGGLMGYPNPDESEYDLFMTGHAGSSVSTALGLKVGDSLMGHPERHSVAVIGDGGIAGQRNPILPWEDLSAGAGRLALALDDVDVADRDEGFETILRADRVVLFAHAGRDDLQMIAGQPQAGATHDDAAIEHGDRLRVGAAHVEALAGDDGRLDVGGAARESRETAAGQGESETEEVERRHHSLIFKGAW